MSQKGTFGLLLVGGGIVVGWLTLVDLFTNTTTAAPVGTINTIFGQTPVTGEPGGKNTQPGTINPKGTQCPPGCVFVPIAGGTTGVCVRTSGSGSCNYTGGGGGGQQPPKGGPPNVGRCPQGMVWNPRLGKCV